MNRRWIHETYQSGTQVVQREGNFAGAHYHVGHLPHDTENDGARGDVGAELVHWINGGEEPWWLEFLQRTSSNTVRTPHGCEIRATGPMIDMDTPPAWGNWKEDDRQDSQIERGLMTDALEKRDRTLIPTSA